jgi:dTDP-4-dehydrorhamnose 3,5-epimerase
VYSTSRTGCLVFETKSFEDQRGCFLEMFKLNVFQEAHLAVFGKEAPAFIQSNLSISKANVIRGLHYQIKNSQGKFVSVVSGHAIDVVVDLREWSSTFGLWEAFELDRPSKSVYVPPGFAHGFLSKSDDTHFFYQVTDVYNKEAERGISPFDSDLSIDVWSQHRDRFIVNEKDMLGVSFRDAEKFNAEVAC